MPNWKKLIVSGSSASLNDLTVATTVTASSFSGDGSGLTNISTDVAEVATVTDTSGRVVVAKGGHIVSGSAQNSDLLQSEPGSYYLNYSNFTSIPGGLISGSAQIVTLTRYEQDISGSTQYTITHGLNEDYPLVQIYDTSKVQVLPGEIKATNSSTVELTFDSNFTGKVVVKK